MSKSVFVRYRGEGFWAFDFITSVLLKHLVDVAAPRATGIPWLSDVVQHWQVVTVISDSTGVNLDENWSDAQVAVVVGLIEEACNVIDARGEIPADEIQSWELLDGSRIDTRGLPVVCSVPVTNLGRAIISLLNGTLPAAPAGTWWWYGDDDQPGTMKRRE